MRVLITGASGLLGEAVLKTAPKEFETIAHFHHSIPGEKADIYAVFNLEKTETIITFLDRQKPQAVIHLAAVADTKLCEKDSELSAKINVTATFIIARWCQQHQIPFIFSSTDMVFDGKHPPYKETDKPNPLMTYGYHKWMAEKKILSVHQSATICRLPLLYGPLRGNAGGVLKFVLDRIMYHEDSRLFRDEYRTPVYTKRVAEALWMILRKRLTGIYHLGGPQKISRYHLGLLVAELYNLDVLKVKPAWLEQTDLSQKRPADISLDSSKAISAGYNPGNLNEDMKAVKEILKKV